MATGLLAPHEGVMVGSGMRGAMLLGVGHWAIQLRVPRAYSRGRCIRPSCLGVFWPGSLL